MKSINTIFVDLNCVSKIKSDTLEIKIDLRSTFRLRVVSRTEILKYKFTKCLKLKKKESYEKRTEKSRKQWRMSPLFQNSATCKLGYRYMYLRQYSILWNMKNIHIAPFFDFRSVFVRVELNPYIHVYGIIHFGQDELSPCEYKILSINF